MNLTISICLPKKFVKNQKKLDDIDENGLLFLLVDHPYFDEFVEVLHALNVERTAGLNFCYLETFVLRSELTRLMGLNRQKLNFHVNEANFVNVVRNVKTVNSLMNFCAFKVLLIQELNY